jgi:hypothetical protein
MKNPWIWAWFVAAGVVVGFIVGRGWDGPAEAPSTQVTTVMNAVPETGTPRGETASTATPSGSTAPQPRPAPPGPAPAPAETPSLPEPAVSGTKSPFAPPVDSGVVTAVDAGEVFRKQIARPSTADAPNQLGDAHRELEREPRDEGWAYTMEADLQNSMINETSMGKFKVEHVECRTTICEVRVSGSGDQADAVRDWSNSMPGNNFNQQLFMNVSSTISSHERIDAIYIFRRPAKGP